MASEAATARLERVVGENRFTIAVVFPVVGATLLLASAWGWLWPPLAFNPALVLGGVVVMRLPVVATLAPLLTRRLLAGLVAISGYAYGVEFVGLATGFPYGEFAYGVGLGPLLPGGLPLGLPLFFLPLVVNAYLLVVLGLGPRLTSARYRLPATVAVVLAIDLVLDPAAVALGLWRYDAAGAYYGVPLSNFAGWLLSATVATALFDLAVDRSALRSRLVACPFALDDLVSFVLLWGVVAAAVGAWIPVGIAAGFAATLARLGRLDLASPRGPAAHGG